jgi:hypothetical protein
LTSNIKEELNRETAKIAWKELQRFFAAGNAIYVDQSLDLIEVAIACRQDNASALKQWLDNNLVHAVSDEQAGQWFDDDVSVWAVVVAPWVLIQEPKGG